MASWEEPIQVSVIRSWIRSHWPMLRPGARIAHTGDLPLGAGEGKYAPETTPLKIGDRQGFVLGDEQLIALDAQTGAEIWRHDPQVSTAIPGLPGRDRLHRPRDSGTQLSGGAQGLLPEWRRAAVPSRADRIARCAHEGTLDGRLIAVDAETAAPAPTLASTARSISKRAWARHIQAWWRSRPR